MIKEVSLPDFFSKPERAQKSDAPSNSSSVDKASTKANDKSSFRNVLSSSEKRNSADRDSSASSTKDSSGKSTKNLNEKVAANSQKRAPVYKSISIRPKQSDSEDADVNAAIFDNTDSKVDDGGEQTPRMERKPASKPEPDDLGLHKKSIIMPLITQQSPTTPQLPKVLTDKGITVEMMEDFKDQQAQVKQQSVQSFMARLQTQYGITPEQVVTAFAKMDQATLMSPPEQVTKKFLANLGVAEEQKPQIGALYQKMVKETGEAEINEKLAAQVMTPPPSVTTAKGRAVLNESLTQMNDSFFRKDAIMQQQLTPQEAAKINAIKSMQAGADTGLQKDDDGLGADNMALMAGLGAAAAATGTATRAKANPGEGMTNANSDVRAGSTASMSSLFPAMSAMNAKTGAQSEGFSGDSDSNAKAKSLEASPTNSGSKADPAGFNIPASGAQGGTTAATLNQQAMGAAVLPNAQHMSAQDRSENINEIVRQAQIIIKKGGGEMTVEMKPEGLGQLNLKVAVENGQVNIQMVAQNDKTKKLLEEGLHELKTSLAAHKLHVDDLKVDLADGFQKRMDQQSLDHQREQSREAASNFLGSMHDDRDSMRQGFYDQPGWKAYRQDPQQRPNMGPATSAAATELAQNVPTRRYDDSKRLNLVA